MSSTFLTAFLTPFVLLLFSTSLAMAMRSFSMPLMHVSWLCNIISSNISWAQISLGSLIIIRDFLVLLTSSSSSRCSSLLYLFLNNPLLLLLSLTIYLIHKLVPSDPIVFGQ
ncbi:hypothetical protein PVAP13_8KG244601 [Panicum virgatum]|uniref:Uncharacterized protein n=1 Tax=Panicum virgatum TaxID=38727 RepID=A0A8T0PZF2_PANVG|nr:hypothetical protein PVAP13_8KG244601 [Panicum virgatum]